MNDTVDWFELLADRVVRGMFIESDNYEYFSKAGPKGLSHDFETGCPQKIGLISKIVLFKGRP